MPGQHTLKRAVKCIGIGLHTGKKIQVTLRPALPNTGIVFHRTDIDPHVSINAQATFVGDTRLATTLIKENIRISTIEHLMSAFSGLGIDNVHVDVHGEEIPIMDGSASIFVFLIESAGVKLQATPKRFMRIKKSIEVTDGDKRASFEPFSGSKFSLTVDFAHPTIQRTSQSISVDISRTTYIKEISRARTFGFMKDIEALQANNLILGGSLENALVFDHEKILNEDGLRYEDEVVRHKLLDAIGDIYLLGSAVIGEYKGYKSGHGLNNQLIRALLLDESAWEYTNNL